MGYRYQRYQIFGKKLDVPNNILNKVYTCTIPFTEFIEYELDDKIPISCILELDRKIVERFGIEKSKELDWELINSHVFYNGIYIRDELLSIDPQTEDINQALYDLLIDRLKPRDYSKRMKERYPDRYIDPSQIDDENLHEVIAEFNRGTIDLKGIVCNWNLFRNKDLSLCLANDSRNEKHITDSELKKFMSYCSGLSNLIVRYDNIYTFIENFSALTSEAEKQTYITQFTDNILSNTQRDYGDYRPPIEPTNEEYRAIFEYSSLEKHLKNVGSHRLPDFLEELKSLPKDYVFNTPIPISVLLNSDVLNFVSFYGYKNVVDFDNECGHFFTKNNCAMLKLMYDMYMHYAGNEHDHIKSIFCDRDGNAISAPYTKDQFYDVMKKMIVYGPSDFNYMDKAPDYRSITGEFRTRNKDLFISDKAPEELQKLFYTKSLTPRIIIEHPEYIPFLNDADLSSCFKHVGIKINGSRLLYDYENLYSFLSSKIGSSNVLNFIVEYDDILNTIFDKNLINNSEDEAFLDVDDDIGQIKRKINEKYRILMLYNRIPYPTHIPRELVEQFPSMFLDKSAPPKLQEAFYSRTINSEFIASHPSYKDYLKNVDLEILFKHMPVKIKTKPSPTSLGFRRHRRHTINIIKAMINTLGNQGALEVMSAYGIFIEQLYEINGLADFTYEEEMEEKDFIDTLDKMILQNIIIGTIKYDENAPDAFKINNPTFFLGKDTPPEIKKKFYNREFTIDDFKNNHDLFKYFNNTNIACGFPGNMGWIIPLFNNVNNNQVANYNRMKVISAYSKIEDVELQNSFREYISEFQDTISIEKIEYVADIISKLNSSNSSEIYTFRKELALQILKSDNPLECLNKIQDVFIKNNIPTVGKIYSCFEILHPDFQGFNFNTSTMSPMLKKSSTISRKYIVFSDLIKSTFGSNNRSVNAYLENIENGSILYEMIKNGQLQFESLHEEEKKELEVFSYHLITLYNNTMKAKVADETYTSSGNILQDIEEIAKKIAPQDTREYNLGDQIINMFCGFTGITTLDQAKKYIQSKITEADSRNRKTALGKITLRKGDFIKGIRPNVLQGELDIDACLRVFPKILQNGSNSKEFLGVDAGSDSTPLDTDLSMVTREEQTMKDTIKTTAARDYGPVWFLLKNDNRFITTRTNDDSPTNINRDMSKIEVFHTGVLGEGHYGIRTGFASCEIDAIIMNEYDPRIGLEIAMNGFYIPVADTEGKILFTPKDYDELRSKMSGLAYYGMPNYSLSKNLISEEILDTKKRITQDMTRTNAYASEIKGYIYEAISNAGISNVVDGFNSDLTQGIAEVYSTGSTSRNTNVPNDSDFDYLIKIDRDIYFNAEKLETFKSKMKETLDFEDGFGGKICGKIKKENGDELDIEISFCPRTDKVELSTDTSLSLKLDAIKKQYPDSYMDVLANIIYAKELFKSVNAYKSLKSDASQGGLGGIGIENWILQHGGSLYDAAKDFVEKAETAGSFENFKKIYQVFDLGDNHYSDKTGVYPHDNFVGGKSKMGKEGFERMLQVLKEYIKRKELTNSEIQQRRL